MGGREREREGGREGGMEGEGKRDSGGRIVWLTTRGEQGIPFFANHPAW
jgi:hypothetical protein